MFKNFNSVMEDQSQIFKIRVSGLQETVAYPGFMNFDTQIIHAWIPRGLLDQGIAIAKTNFQSCRMRALENPVQIQQFGIELQAVSRHQLDQRPLLRGRESSVTSHKASDCAPMSAVLADLHKRKYYKVSDPVQAKA